MAKAPKGGNAVYSDSTSTGTLGVSFNAHIRQHFYIPFVIRSAV